MSTTADGDVDNKPVVVALPSKTSSTASVASSGVAVELDELLPEMAENGTTSRTTVLLGETVLLPCKAYSLGQRTVIPFHLYILRKSLPLPTAPPSAHLPINSQQAAAGAELSLNDCAVEKSIDVVVKNGTSRPAALLRSDYKGKTLCCCFCRRPITGEFLGTPLRPPTLLDIPVK